MPLSRFSSNAGILILLALLLAPGTACDRNTGAEVPESVIATINDQQVLREEFFFYLKANFADQLESKDATVLSAILDDYLEQRALVTVLHGMGIAPTEEEIAEYLRFMGQDALLKSTDLEQKRILALNTSLVLAEEKLRNLARKQVPDVTTKEIQAYYDQNVNEFLRGESFCFKRYASAYKDLLVDARYWIVSRKKKDAFIRKRFQDIQIEENCYETEDIPESFLKVLQKLKPGRMSPIVSTKLGTASSYNMFRLVRKIAPRKLDLAEVSRLIEQKIRSRRLADAVKEERARLRRQVRITVYRDHILLFNYAGKLPVATGEEES